VYPGAVFTNVGHLTEERVQTGGFDRFSEGFLMHARRAGRYHNVGELLFLNGFFEQVLSRVGAHVFVVGGKGYAGEIADFPGNSLDIDCSGYVLAAVADKYAYSGHL
jgi:hypothetical protein